MKTLKTAKGGILRGSFPIPEVSKYAHVLKQVTDQ